MDTKLCIPIPNSEECIYPNCKVKLGRFLEDRWRVKYGWYSWGGNRPTCGWYLTAESNPDIVKPLQLTDLDDIYILDY